MDQNVKLTDDIPMTLRPKIRFWVAAAAMDEDDLKAEIRGFYDRGFGGVEVVMLNTLPESILTGEDGWGTPNWNRIVQVIAETTQSLGMSMDLANGPMWPIAMPGVADADHPAACCELTYGVIRCPRDGSYRGPLPERTITHAEGTPHLIAVMAYLETAPKVLSLESYTDLMPYVTGLGEDAALTDQTMLTCSLPYDGGSRWRIFAFYRQPSCHKVDVDQYYVIDHLSEAGVKACEAYWEPILSSEAFESMESIFCDSLEYASAMDWTPKYAEEFERRRGYAILPYLPFIGAPHIYPVSDVPGYAVDDAALAGMLDRDYRETLTQLYCEYHLAGLTRLAEKYGKTIRYQTAYNKPFEGERCPLYVGIPENEALGRPAMDYQKTMAAAAHLSRKPRYSFECCAEFGTAYGQDYEDLMWWVKRSLMSGMDAQVFHGASYSGAYHGKYAENGQIPGVVWPGYEAFGKAVSNYWNRTLSVEDARGCLDTIARLNGIFRNRARVDCAIYRQQYENNGMGSEFCFYPDDGALMNAGYSYETISPFLLNLPVCTVRDGRLDPDGVGYQCLIIPETDHISGDCLGRIADLMDQGLPVVRIGRAPVNPEYFSEWHSTARMAAWQKHLERVLRHPQMIHAGDPSQVPGLLAQRGILPGAGIVDVFLPDADESGAVGHAAGAAGCMTGASCDTAGASMDIVTAKRIDDAHGKTYFAFYGYNRVVCSPDNPNPYEIAVSSIYKQGTTKSTYQRPGAVSRRRVQVSLDETGGVWQYDPWTGKSSQAPGFVTDEGGRMTGCIDIEEDEMILLEVRPGKDNVPETAGKCASCMASETTGKCASVTEKMLPITFDHLELTPFVPDTVGETSFLRSHFASESRMIRPVSLKPWKDLAPDLEAFAGKGVYDASFVIPRSTGEQPGDLDGRRYILQLGCVSDTFHVEVNGCRADFPDQVMKRVDITDLVQAGENRVRIEVVSNLYNRLQSVQGEDRLPFKVPYFPRNYGIWECEGHTCGIVVLRR